MAICLAFAIDACRGLVRLLERTRDGPIRNFEVGLSLREAAPRASHSTAAEIAGAASAGSVMLSGRIVLPRTIAYARVGQ